MVRSIGYTMRIMGARIDGNTNLFINNDLVCKSTRRPEDNLKMKHVCIFSHAVRE